MTGDDYGPESRKILEGLEPVRPRPPVFDSENPTTVHDVLWSWSTGHLTDSQVVEILHLDADDDLDEIARENRVPQPKERKP